MIRKFRSKRALAFVVQCNRCPRNQTVISSENLDVIDVRDQTEQLGWNYYGPSKRSANLDFCPDCKPQGSPLLPEKAEEAGALSLVGIRFYDFEEE